jgi:hypothetical protein
VKPSIAAIIRVPGRSTGATSNRIQDPQVSGVGLVKSFESFDGFGILPGPQASHPEIEVHLKQFRVGSKLGFTVSRHADSIIYRTEIVIEYNSIALSQGHRTS